MHEEARFSCQGKLDDGRAFICPKLSAATWPAQDVPADAVPFSAQQLVIGPGDPRQEWTFALTNLLLQNFSVDSGAGTSTLKNGNVTALLVPKPDYGVRMKHLRAYKGIDVTATLRLSAVLPEYDLNDIARDLCLILSVLTGRMVNWIAKEGGPSLVFEHRVTKSSSGWPVLGRLEKVLGGKWTWTDLLEYAVAVLPLFEQRAASYRLRQGIINLWIDARVAADFLEARALKTAVVLEMIKTDYRNHHNSQLRNFREFLETIHQELGLITASDALKQVVKIRNSVVHEGRFSTQCPHSPVDQYERLAHCTDRVVLALVGFPVESL